MVNYKEQYLKLFVAAADALDHMNIGQAREILLQAQLAAEEAHMQDLPASEVCDFLKKI